MKHTITILLAALVLAAALTACGSRDNGTVSTTPNDTVNGGSQAAPNAPVPEAPSQEAPGTGSAKEDFGNAMDDFKDGDEEFGSGIEQGIEDAVEDPEQRTRSHSSGTGMAGSR